MQTVIRGQKSEITHVHLYGRLYVTPADHKIIIESEITAKMIEKIKYPNHMFMAVLTDNLDILEAKRKILRANGVKFEDNDRIL